MSASGNSSAISTALHVSATETSGWGRDVPDARARPDVEDPLGNLRATQHLVDGCKIVLAVLSDLESLVLAVEALLMSCRRTRKREWHIRSSPAGRLASVISVLGMSDMKRSAYEVVIVGRLVFASILQCVHGEVGDNLEGCVWRDENRQRRHLYMLSVRSTLPVVVQTLTRPPSHSDTVHTSAPAALPHPSQPRSIPISEGIKPAH